MSLFFPNRPQLQAHQVVLEDRQPNEDEIGVSIDIWSTLLDYTQDGESKPSRVTVSLTPILGTSLGGNDEPGQGSRKLLKAATYWATLDTTLPQTSFIAPFSTSTSQSSGHAASLSNYKSYTHSITPTNPPTLTEVFILALSNSAYAVAQSHSSDIEARFAYLSPSESTKRVVRQGEIIQFAFSPTEVPNGHANGHTASNEAIPPFKYEYKVLMAEPVLQGFVDPGATRFTVVPPQSDSPENPPAIVLEDEVSSEMDGDDGFQIDESFLAGSVYQSREEKRQYDLKALKRPAQLDMDDLDEEAIVFVRTEDLGSVGLFSGDWASMRGSGKKDARLVRIFGGDNIPDKRPTRVSYASPILASTITTPITLHPTPFSHENHPPIPTATSATIARVASPHSTDKRFQPEFLKGLKEHFQGRKRLVKEGDLIAVHVFGDGKNAPYNNRDGDNTDGEDESVEYDFAVGSGNPSNVVFFKITNLEYDVLDTTASASRQPDGERTPDPYVAATMGELGCFIDPTVTKMIQRGLEHSRVPDIRVYCSLDTGFAALNRESRLATTSGAPFEKLWNIVEATLVPNASDYDLPVSVLLKGSRGIGKQTIARWVAEDLGIHVYEINCFTVVGETEVKTEGTLRARFERATECSPCIFLLRHIEALARTTQSLETGREPSIIPAIRDCLDSLQQAWKLSGFPVILVATTSDYEHVPLGVLACFKHEIAFEVPNEPERLDILQGLLSNVTLSPDVSLPHIATQTAALVAADLVDLVSRTQMAAMERALKATENSSMDSTDLVAAGIQYTGADFELALNKARASYSESIGAPKIPNVSWDDVGGLANVKQDILDTIQLPLEHPELFADGLKKRSGILLYGPPGTGKTLLAKAVATSCSLNFFSVKGPELLNMYIGESEANVRRVFQRARDAKPCVIFFDELDSVAPKRGNHGDSGGVMDRIVSQLLAELDGMADGKGGADVFVIGATNRPDLLDPALLRPGRFDRMLYLGVSDTHDAQLKIIQALTRKFRLDPALDLRIIAEQCPFNYTGADFYALCSDAMLKAMSRKAQEIDAVIAKLNEQPPPYSHPHPITPQYYLAEIATDAETDVLVSEADFRAALAELVPSVSGSEMDHYKQVQQRFAKDTINSLDKGKSVQVEDGPPEPTSWKGKGKAKAS